MFTLLQRYNDPLQETKSLKNCDFEKIQSVKNYLIKSLKNFKNKNNPCPLTQQKFDHAIESINEVFKNFENQHIQHYA